MDKTICESILDNLKLCAEDRRRLDVLCGMPEPDRLCISRTIETLAIHPKLELGYVESFELVAALGELLAAGDTHD